MRPITLAMRKPSPCKLPTIQGQAWRRKHSQWLGTGKTQGIQTQNGVWSKLFLFLFLFKVTMVVSQKVWFWFFVGAWSTCGVRPWLASKVKWFTDGAEFNTGHELLIWLWSSTMAQTSYSTKYPFAAIPMRWLPTKELRSKANRAVVQAIAWDSTLALNPLPIN